MDRIKTTEGDVIIRDGRFAIVASRFNEFIVESLIKASLHCLRQHGAADGDIEIFRVPGAYEMSIAIDKVAATRRFDGIVALGAVIRGGTPHFEIGRASCRERV
jgi:6,7-dimethyl-8-ribityllumazine synthase